MDLSIKDIVKKKYGDIASNVSRKSQGSCCSSSCCGAVNSYGLYDAEIIKSLPIDAVNVSLGCANPLVFAALKEGEIVLDLGSGGGIDVLLASRYVGSSGKVYGLDMTDEMLSLANKNKDKSGVKNVEFLKGYIEDIPLPDKSVDVIMSNCVINLSEDKEKALSEAYRVLKEGGRFAVADIVTLKEVPEEIKKSIEMWIGCFAGALSIDNYKDILKKVGFTDIEIEPVNLYTKDVILELMKTFNAQDLKLNFALIDSAFAGAAIKAKKQ